MCCLLCTHKTYTVGMCSGARIVHTLRFYIAELQLSAISCQVTKSNSRILIRPSSLLGRSKVGTILIINRRDAATVELSGEDFHRRDCFHSRKLLTSCRCRLYIYIFSLL